MQSLLTIEVAFEQDVVLARQRARLVAGLLGFDAQDQVRIATAVSEVARDALLLSASVELAVDSGALLVRLRAGANSAPLLQAAVRGETPPDGVAGLGIQSARRVMDRFSVDSANGTTTLVLSKTLPRKASELSPERLAEVRTAVERADAGSVYQEFQAQNSTLR